MIALLGTALLWYLTVAALVGMALLGRAHTRLQLADVALTSLMWPFYAVVVAGTLVCAVCAILICGAALLTGWILRRARLRR